MLKNKIQYYNKNHELVGKRVIMNTINHVESLKLYKGERGSIFDVYFDDDLFGRINKHDKDEMPISLSVKFDSGLLTWIDAKDIIYM